MPLPFQRDTTRHYTSPARALTMMRHHDGEIRRAEQKYSVPIQEREEPVKAPRRAQVAFKGPARRHQNHDTLHTHACTHITITHTSVDMYIDPRVPHSLTPSLEPVITQGWEMKTPHCCPRSTTLAIPPIMTTFLFQRSGIVSPVPSASARGRFRLRRLKRLARSYGPS